ncbi:SDR family NAD(P)-dependent oxidoreductase [Paraburkholderia oxyphila]|uniref:SDR family NAD(P)-dependent oxidoreductase n=1 Tax=Paraburkholderia oxyphila TaxID=614212 RepID=UPI0005B860CE|nr:SDR family oxidoreductase [Paraburkholderia oxyphila]
MSNSNSELQLDGKVAVIIGGNGAIGSETAKTLAAAGATVVLAVWQDPHGAAQQAAALPGSGHGAVEADITSESSLRKAAADVVAKWGRVDILVNAAGKTFAIPHGDLDALTDEIIDSVFLVNYRGVFSSIRAFAPALRESGDGLIVNVSSIAATTAIGSNVAYCGAKAALDNMTKALGRALAPGIRVLGVSPGVVDTAFVPGRSKDFNEKAAATTPLKRIGQVEDIARAIEACATRLTFSTGVTIVVDGGRHL